MMKFYKKLSLTHQLYVLYALTVTIILLSSFLFYQVAFRSLRNKESLYMNNMLTQVAQRTEDITSAVQLVTDTIANSSTANYLLSETNNSKRWKYKQSLNSMINEIAKSNHSIKTILLLDTMGQVYSFNGSDYALANRLDSIYDIFSFSQYPDGFTGALTLSKDDTTYYACKRSIYAQNASFSDKQIIGSCLILCTSEPLHDICSNTASSPKSIFAILDPQQQIIARDPETNTDLSSDMISSIVAAEEASVSENINGETYLINHLSPLSGTHWKVYSIIPYSDISSDLSQLQELALFFICILLLAFFILIRQIRNAITQPLMKIVDFVQKEPYYTLHHRLTVHGPREIEKLSLEINQMLDQIDELSHTVLQNQARLYEIELANNQARLSALQSQINPHFLYNTLDAIHGLTYLGKCEEIRTTITALSFLLRYSIKGEEKVLIKEELKSIRKYLQIIDIRFSQRINIDIQIDEQILNYSMPRFLLQPLVENAVFHGLEPLHNKGSLTLYGTLLPGNILHFECRDNGIGISEEKLLELNRTLQNASQTAYKEQSNNKIGLLNIQMRIQLLYGPSYGLSISSTLRNGTSVCLDFPTEA